MASSDDRRTLKDFRDHVSELAATWYEDDEAKAFRHAAFQLTLPDPNVADTTIIELTAIDKSGDLEIDGYFVDDQDETILLFQSEGGTTRTGEAKAAKFWMAPEALLEPARVDASNNQSVRALSVQLDEALSKGYTLRLVFASKSGFEAAATRFGQSRQITERPLTLKDGGITNCSCSLEMVDEKNLANQFEDYRAGYRIGGNTTATLSVDERMQYPVEGDNLKSLRVTVKASEIVRVFKTEGLGYRLFSLNPRGPLANAKVNKNIARELSTEDGRKRFHLLNNGLCATCENFTFEGQQLTVENLQIVNGCQTTVTLANRTTQELEETLVDVKLTVADRDLAERIAIASNSQTALRARDYAAFEKQQMILQYEFEREVSPPWFYEVKQGYWKMVLSDPEKAKYKTGKRKRHIEVQSLAQASLAFLGKPDIALDRVRFVFEGIRNPEEWEIYDTAFPSGVRAQQLLLPWRILDALERSSLERMRFSTFHTIWLIADFLRKSNDVKNAQYFSATLTQKLTDSIDGWLPSLTRVANTACRLAVRRAQNISGGEDQMDIRDFFRASSELMPGVNPKDLLYEAFTDELNAETDAGRNPSDLLPK